MRYRVAKIDDLPMLNTISLKSKQHWGYPPEWMAQWQDDLAITEALFAKQRTLVAETRRAVAGFCGIAYDGGVYEICHLWLLPEYIGQGHGKRLLATAIDAFVSAGGPIVVTADPNAEAFYQSQGFATVGQVASYPKGRYLPLMRKAVSALPN